MSSDSFGPPGFSGCLRCAGSGLGWTDGAREEAGGVGMYVVGVGTDGGVGVGASMVGKV
jgi:hypothetical protein